MTGRPLQPDLESVARWWTTSIADVKPNVVRFRGYPIAQLIAHVDFTSVIWLLLRGDLPRPFEARLLDGALVASADHGPQAPSIAAARMAATCGVGVNSAMATGIGMLGDIHGGAGEQCMDLLALIFQGAREGGVSVESSINSYRRTHTYIPGFGHRIHSTDPRCAPLRALLDDARRAGHISGAFVEVGDRIEEYLGEVVGTHVPMNVDGITAIVFSELGFSPALGRGLFSLSRGVGILAHAWEEMNSGRRLKGPMPPVLGSYYEGPTERSVPSTRALY